MSRETKTVKLDQLQALIEAGAILDAFIIEDQDGRFHEGIKLQKDAEKVRQDLTAQRAEQEKLRREAEYSVKKSVIDEERLRRQTLNRQN